MSRYYYNKRSGTIIYKFPERLMRTELNPNTDMKCAADETCKSEPYIIRISKTKANSICRKWYRNK